MLEEISKWILYFFIYSIGGYILEVIWCSLRQKKLVGRGMLFGPWCPIYGFGSILLVATMWPFRDNVVLVYLAAMLICSSIEYFASYLLEKLFKLKLWDYTDSDEYNLNGRICARNSFAFGFGGCVIIYVLQPMVNNFMAWLSPAAVPIIAFSGLAIMLIDTFFAWKVALEGKKRQGVIRMMLRNRKTVSEEDSKAFEKKFHEIRSEAKRRRKK